MSIQVRSVDVPSAIDRCAADSMRESNAILESYVSAWLRATGEDVRNCVLVQQMTADGYRWFMERSKP